MRPRGSLRVAGGTARGNRLRGTLSPEARPTTERVRSAIFNVLPEEVYWGRRVLDLYAGSGSLGIEGLSRGAAWADFVERSSRQCAVIRANLEHTGFSRQARVYCGEVTRLLASLPGGYSLVVLDPPYSMSDLATVLEEIDATPRLLAAGAMVVAGHSRHGQLPPRLGGLTQESHRRYGDNVVDFYRREA